MGCTSDGWWISAASRAAVTASVTEDTAPEVVMDGHVKTATPP